MKPTVACVWVEANVPYSVDYVRRLQSMVRRHLKEPHDFVCLTDRPDALPDGVTPIEVPPVKGIHGWWRKLELFSGRLRGRVLYLDLDTLVVADLQPILNYPAACAFVPDGGSFQPRTGHQVVKRLNSSVMVFEATHPPLRGLYDRWTPAESLRLWGDQDWIGEQLEVAPMMPAEWFPRLSSCHGGVPEGAKVVLAKVPKNEEAARRFPWVAEAWA